jgi:hypothetical protein
VSALSRVDQNPVLLLRRRTTRVRISMNTRSAGRPQQPPKGSESPPGLPRRRPPKRPQARPRTPSAEATTSPPVPFHGRAIRRDTSNRVEQSKDAVHCANDASR